jgi:muramoyltetrapeptide carboxypeptidase
MLKPQALRPGGRLAIVAPASPFDRREFEEGIAEIRRLGFVPVYDDTIFARRGFVAGPAELRAAAIRAAWEDPSIAGIVAVRGGYGSVQVLPLLDPADARRARKPFVGYSDLTAVLTFLTMHCGMVAFHGPMLDGRLGRGPAGYDRDSFEKALCRTEPMGELEPPGLETIVTGEARGVLVGGTLTQVLASIGTPYAFDPPSNHVLFLDEVGERPYKLDRMVTQLRHTGLLAKAGAIVVGQLPRCDEPSGPPTARAVIADLFQDFPGPVLFGFPSGHTTGPAVTLPFGVAVRVVADGRPRLIVEEAAVQ